MTTKPVLQSAPNASPATREQGREFLTGLDQAAVAYLVLPLVIFLAGWVRLSFALPTILMIAYSLRHLAQRRQVNNSDSRASSHTLVIVIVFSIAWVLLSGLTHQFFANSDWYVRDAVLHDLVASPWPVGYGSVSGKTFELRAPLAYYLPAALIGKVLGLSLAHYALFLWTLIGVIIFLLQALQITRSDPARPLLTLSLIAAFSGMDIVGNLINIGPRFTANWHITSHLEWWAGLYQYSSMTTQLFWVPNHALAGWITIGILGCNRNSKKLDEFLPLIFVADFLWSPLTAIGLIPFFLLYIGSAGFLSRLKLLLKPQVVLPPIIAAFICISYLTMDSEAVPKGWTLSLSSSLMDGLLNHAQFVLLEAGLLGICILIIQPSYPVVIALLTLAILPFVYLGEANDLVMRASIPSLAILSLACVQCVRATPTGIQYARSAKVALMVFLVLGSVTPVQEIARSMHLSAWPIDKTSSLSDVTCAKLPHHYVANVDQVTSAFTWLKPPVVSLSDQGKGNCGNPALAIMAKAGIL